MTGCWSVRHDLDFIAAAFGALQTEPTKTKVWRVAVKQPRADVLNLKNGRAASVSRRRYERPRTGNPNALTIRQHILPTVSIARFANVTGYVDVQHIQRDIRRPARSTDAIFCTIRAWHEAAETGFMKQIEDRFQTLAEAIMAVSVAEIRDPSDVHALTMFYALWYMRARFRNPHPEDVVLNDVLPGDEHTQEQQENLEKNGYVFARGNAIPAHQMNGFLLQMRVGAFAHGDLRTVRWSRVEAQAGEFIVPDVPVCLSIPLTPTVSLMAGPDDGKPGQISEAKLAEFNRLVRANSQNYFFARDLAACPF
jgi:hypothetical protein